MDVSYDSSQKESELEDGDGEEGIPENLRLPIVYARGL